MAAGSPPARSMRSRASSEAADGGLAGGAHERGAGAGQTPGTPAVAAAAHHAAGDHPHVPDLGGHAEGAAVELAVQHDAAADTGADGDEQEVVDVLAGTEGELAPGGRVGVVLDDHREVHVLLQLGLQVDVPPRQVGREVDPRPGVVDVPRGAHADAGDVVARPELGHQARDRSLDRLDVLGRRLDLQLLQDAAVGVDDAPGDLGAADVDATRQSGAAHELSSGQSSSRTIFSTGSVRRPAPGSPVGAAGDRPRCPARPSPSARRRPARARRLPRTGGSSPRGSAADTRGRHGRRDTRCTRARPRPRAPPPRVPPGTPGQRGGRRVHPPPALPPTRSPGPSRTMRR